MQCAKSSRFSWHSANRLLLLLVSSLIILAYRVFSQAKPDEWFQCPPGFWSPPLFSESNPLSQKNYYIPWNNDGFNDQLLTILDLMWTQWSVDSLKVVGNYFYNRVKQSTKAENF